MDMQWLIHILNSSRSKSISLQMTDWCKGIFYSHTEEYRLGAKWKRS